MDEFVERIYLKELLVQCTFGFSAFERMKEILDEIGKPGSKPREITSEFFREAGDFLQHSSAVSRLLWPPGHWDRAKKKRAESRGAHLRQMLGFDDNHVLRNRDLRDFFEHFDSRLDDWAEESPNRIYVDQVIGGPRSVGGSSMTEHDIVRRFDPASKEMVIRGERFNVVALLGGLSDVRDRAEERLKQLDADRRLQATRAPASSSD